MEPSKRNAEWAKEQLQKCLNAYSELPTTHVNQSSHRLPLFPLSPSNISLYLPFLSFSHRHLGFRARRPTRAEQTQREDEEDEEEVRTEREQEPGAEAGMRQVFLCACCVCVRLSVHTYAVCSVPAVCLSLINEAVVVGAGGGVSGPAWLLGSILSCRC